MEPMPEAADDADRPRRDGELRLVREAILMVASNASPRVVVAGLWFGDLIVESCTRLAEDAGVVLVPLRSRGTGRLDFAVQRGASMAPQPVTGWPGRPALEAGR